MTTDTQKKIASLEAELVRLKSQVKREAIAEDLDRTIEFQMSMTVREAIAWVILNRRVGGHPELSPRKQFEEITQKVYSHLSKQQLALANDRSITMVDEVSDSKSLYIKSHTTGETGLCGSVDLAGKLLAMTK